MAEHEISYRAGTQGFGHLGIADGSPRWVCTCGEWQVPVQIRAGGPNRAHGRRAHAQHIADVRRHLDGDT